MNKQQEIKPSDFFKCWKEVCIENDKMLMETYDDYKEWTNSILGKDNCIIVQVAKKFEQEIYCEYYSLDAVMHGSDDFVTQNPNENEPRKDYFLKRISVAFEHENDYKTAYKEISHLLTTMAELKVLVTYIDKEKADELADKLAAMTKGVDNSEILVIIGFKNTKIEWKGYIIENDGKKAIV